MTHEEFMALRGGELVVIDGVFIGQVCRVLRYCAGNLLRIGKNRRGAVTVRHGARELEIKYTNEEGRRITGYFLVHVEPGILSNAGMLARLELWKGQ